MTSHTDLVGDTDYFYTFCCPLCSKATDIPEKDIPSSIRRIKLEHYKRNFDRRMVR